MSEKQEMVLTVPAELLTRFTGMSFDIGGSLMKFAYRAKEDGAANVGHASSETGRLHLVSFPKCELKEAIEFIRQRSDITRNDDGTPPVIYATGIGSLDVAASICAASNIRVEFHLNECDCNVRGFVYLARRLPRDELLEPFQEDAMEEPIAQMKSLKQLFDMGAAADMGRTFCVVTDGRTFWDALQRISDRPSKIPVTAATDRRLISLVEAEPDTFPCLTVGGGSTFMYTLIDKEGRSHLIDGFNNGGAAFLGMGKLMVGAKTFSELMDLASNGDSQKVDKFMSLCSNDIPADPNDTCPYLEHSKLKSYLCYAFGHVLDTNTDELRREDVARALLNYVIRDFVRSVQFLCQIRSIRRVFFYGGLCSHPFVRRTITAEFIYRMLCHRVMDEVEPYVDFDFIRPGVFLGALGCAINSVDKFMVGNTLEITERGPQPRQY